METMTKEKEEYVEGMATAVSNYRQVCRRKLRRGRQSGVHPV